MQRTTIFLTSLEKEKLAKRSKETGISIAEIIRRAIDEHLAALRTGHRKEH
jgi:hypothetical protein